MKIKWRHPKGTEKFDDVKMAEFYAARAKYVRHLQANNIREVSEQEIDQNALKNMD